MKFSTTLLAVRDLEKSLKFYKEIFDQDVTCDLGWNKTLTCGLTLQLNFDIIADFPRENMKFKPYNMELYFETDDMDSFMALLSEHPEVERLGDLKKYPWHQRVIHIFDPDGHLIEVGESMKHIAFKFFEEGLSVEETSKETQHPIELVQKWYEDFSSEK